VGKRECLLERSVAPALDEGVVERTKPESYEFQSESEEKEKEIRTKGSQRQREKFQVELHDLFLH